jgi:hypothetical protein
MRFIYAIWLLGLSVSVFSQITIQGTVTDEQGLMIPGANVFLKGSIEGTTTDAKGNFMFTSKKTGQQTLVVSFIGYITQEKTITITGKILEIKIKLIETVSHIDDVTVTAGSFEASDEKKAVALKPLDIVTVANSVGDIMGALATLPGTQRGATDGYLIVRGGDATETKTFIDGSCVEKPYTSHMPDLPSRGRFSPMLFKGTMFSTGGFSAQYGQALSSVLQLETVGLAEKSQAALQFMSVGLGASFAYLNDSNYSVTSEAMYANMAPYYGFTGSSINWTENPQSASDISTARFKIGKRGMLKTMVQLSKTSSGMMYDNLDSNRIDSLKLRNSNVYINNSYQTTIGKKTNLGINSGMMIDKDDLYLGDISLLTNITALSVGAWAKHFFQGTTIKYGVQSNFKQYNQHYFVRFDTTNAKMTFTQPLYSAFVEFENNITKRFVLKHGYRYEYSGINHEQTLSPRLSCAYKVSEYSQVSAAWGMFRQLQGDDYMKFNHNLSSSDAIQYIVNYQYQKNDRLFRTEAYYKNYTNLITYQTLNNPDPVSYATTGYGKALGMDVFYRDTKTVHNGDFWVSYSYINTERKYKDYPTEVQPEYVSPQAVSVVYKQFFPKIQTQLGFSYMYTSGKRYNNPNQATFMASSLKDINDLSLCFTYLTRIFKRLTVIHGSVSNILGFDNTYAYRFAGLPDASGIYRSVSIKPVAKRMIFLGIFITI